MREIRPYGSVRGAASDGRPYRDIWRRCSRRHWGAPYFVGTRAFSSSTQFSTTTMPVGVDVGSPPAALIIKNVWPSRETS
jgi:hypothetical protein